MSVNELIKSAEFLVDANGNKKAVQLGLDVWGEIITLLQEVAEDEVWDALLSTDESQRLLETMADEALAQIEAGKSKPMAFTPTGEIAPG